MLEEIGNINQLTFRLRIASYDIERRDDRISTRVGYRRIDIVGAISLLYIYKSAQRKGFFGALLEVNGLLVYLFAGIHSEVIRSGFQTGNTQQIAI